MHVLITVPPRAKGGGVANFVRVTTPGFTVPVELVVRGSRERGEPLPRRLLRMAMDYVTFARAAASPRCRLVHQNTSFGTMGLLRDALVVVLVKLLRRPLVVFFHGWDASLQARMRGIRLLAFRAVYFRADAMIVLASGFRESLQGWGYRGPVYEETTAVDDAYVHAPRAERRDEELKVLYLARVEREKGIYTAIDAVGALRAQGIPARLVVAGDGTELAAARRAVGDAGQDHVDFLGFVSGQAKIDALMGADVYLFPTTHGEGMATTVLEAMACGLPVVTRAVGGVGDFFQDGRMGFITERTDTAAFTEALAVLARDRELRERIGRFNRGFAAERFVVSRVVSRLEGIYAGLTDARKGA